MARDVLQVGTTLQEAAADAAAWEGGSGGASASGGDGDLHEQELQQAVLATMLAADVALAARPTTHKAALRHLEQDWLPAACQLAEALIHWWRRPKALEAAALELAQAVAARRCAYLRCTSLGAEGGPAALAGAGSKPCSGCRVCRYCGPACAHADWRAGHRKRCAALGQVRREQRAAAQAPG